MKPWVGLAALVLFSLLMLWASWRWGPRDYTGQRREPRRECRFWPVQCEELWR